MLKQQEENIIKSIIRGYRYCNEVFLPNIKAISRDIQINEPYGILRNFSIKANCMLYSNCSYTINKICNCKYPVFKLDDNTTFTLHYDNVRNKMPLYVINLSKININQNNLFSPSNNSDQQHFMIKYSGKDKLETLNMYKIVVENNNASFFHIKTFTINDNIMFESENKIEDPQFDIKENKKIEEKIKELRCS